VGRKLASLDPAPALAVKGVKQVIEVEDGFAVIANSYWQARKGLDALAPNWDLGEHANASSDAMRAEFKSDLDRRGVIAHEEGDAYASLEGAEKVIEADYDAPYLAHLAMEPVNCTVAIAEDRVDVWTGTQNPESSSARVSSGRGGRPPSHRPPVSSPCPMEAWSGSRTLRACPRLGRRRGRVPPLRCLIPDHCGSVKGHWPALARVLFKARDHAPRPAPALTATSFINWMLWSFNLQVEGARLNRSKSEGEVDKSS
jgi:Aerobic-type carbon monoxide dehydrogenase, large subunit CoxL/CutL homologs